MSLIARRRIWKFFEALYSQELNETSPRAPTPEWIKTPLLPHQQSAVGAALQIEKAKVEGISVGDIAGDPVGGTLFSSHGIIADPVGSGKSLIALSLVKSPPPPAEYKEYIVRGQSIMGDGRDTGLFRVRSQLETSLGLPLRRVSTSLFIVPHALMSQWETYVSRDTSLRACFIRKRADATSDTLLANIENYDVLFVSSTMWSVFKVCFPISTIVWTRVFVDEADSINITTDYDDIHGLFYWFISASWLNLVFAYGATMNILTTYTPPTDTPQSVIKRVEKLQGSNAYLSIPGCRHNNIARRMCNMIGGFMSMNPACSQSARLIVHSSEDYIRSSFSMPEVTNTEIVCATPANIRVLDSFISDAMMEQLNAGDLSGALEELGMTSHSEQSIVDAVTQSLTKDLENARRTYEYKKGQDYSTVLIKQKALEACEHKIASLESRIEAIRDRIKRASEQTCPICYCDINNPSVTPCCHQLFCFGCLCECLKRTAACPLCRFRISDITTIKVVGGGDESTGGGGRQQHKPLQKADAFVQFLLNNPNARVLMFSSYDATFTQMEDKLKEANLKYAMLNGSQSRITKLLKEFKEGKYNTLFLNARNMGAGLNIDAATHVVLYHRMSNDLESQIVGRAMRLGRSAPLSVVRLVHENERSAAAAAATISHA